MTQFFGIIAIIWLTSMQITITCHGAAAELPLVQRARSAAEDLTAKSRDSVGDTGTVDKRMSDCNEDLKNNNMVGYSPASAMNEKSSDIVIDSSKTITKEERKRRLPHPNIVLIVTDQERSPTSYEDENLKAFRAKHLHGYREMGCSDYGDDVEFDTGCVEFKAHYTAATACTPSRANLYTGQYSSLHGVSQTAGLKTEDDPEVTFLRPYDVPTMGNYFETGGYDTKYIGKWHISPEDLLNRHPTKPLTSSGRRNATAEGIYMQEDPLKKFGFHGWIGPEPFGRKKVNTGIWRDPQFVQQTIEFIEERNRTASMIKRKDNDNESGDKPFLLALNLVNPHDICLWAGWRLYDFPFKDESVPGVIPPPPTYNEDLSSKPSQQSSWKKWSTIMYDGIQGFGGLSNFWVNEKKFHRKRQLYFYLQKLADQHIATVVKTLKDTPFWENTIVVRTSDHGDMLGAHGLQQKWYSAYDEEMRVPFLISSPLFRHRKKIELNFPTSSVDILPTILSLGGLDAESLAKILRSTHSEVHPLVGEDLSKFVLKPENTLESSDNDNNKNKTDRSSSIRSAPTSVYSTMTDHVTKSSNQKYILFRQKSKPLVKLFSNFYHFEMDSVQGPSSIEMVVATVNGTRWKLVRSYDDPSKWTAPHESDTYFQRAGIFAGRGTKSIKYVPLLDEWELYNLNADPIESKNLIHELKQLDYPTNKNKKYDMEALMKRGQIESIRDTMLSELQWLRKEKLSHRNQPYHTPPLSSTMKLNADIGNGILESFEEKRGKVGVIILLTFQLMSLIVYQEPVILAITLVLIVVQYVLIIIGLKKALFRSRPHLSLKPKTD